MAGVAGVGNGSELSVAVPELDAVTKLIVLFQDVCDACDPYTSASDCGCPDFDCECYENQLMGLEERVKKAFQAVNPGGDPDVYWSMVLKCANYLPQIKTESFYRSGR